MNKKVRQNKAHAIQTDRQAAKISTLSSGNVSKYIFLTGEDVLPERASTMNRFEYLLLDRELTLFRIGGGHGRLRGDIWLEHAHSDVS